MTKSITASVAALLGIRNQDFCAVDAGSRLAKLRPCRPATFMGLARRVDMTVELHDDGAVAFVWWHPDREVDSRSAHLLNAWISATPGGMSALREYLADRARRGREGQSYVAA
ncbi:MAG TPA: hypothetical protein VNQ99_04795 [Xanthobacteraceae bacterium]|nr:hypothetical protein [Xanthobacteraceae bacterium]